MDDKLELKHWGILGMKWGLRRFQNEDGSLTPEGRERYGVGNSKNKKAVSIHDISDDELHRMTKRLYAETNYLDARNKFIQSQAYYSKMTAKPDKMRPVKNFLSKVFGQSVMNYLQKDVEFALAIGTSTILDQAGSEYAKEYLNYVLNQNKKKNKNKNNNNNNNNDEDDD